MRSPSQTPRSLASVILLLLALGGCSSAELASGGDYEPGGDELGDGDGDGDPTGEPSETETGEDETGGDDGGDDEDNSSPGVEDPVLAVAQCDPDAEQGIALDLAQAQAEVAPMLVRESVLAGSGTVPAIPLSPQPFLNHFSFGYPSAEDWDPEISGELWKPPMVNVDAPTRYRLQYAVRGPAVQPEQRGPVDLAIIVDLGPSMAGEPLALAEEALAALEAALLPGDRVTLIAAGEAPEILSSAKIENFGLTPLTGMIGELGLASAANVSGALDLAYATVEQEWEGQGQPRVLLISNGHFQSDAALPELVEDHAVDGRYLVALGLGDPELFAHAPLSELAEEGRGSLLYARTADELWLDLQERFTAHMLVAAAELELTLRLPPGLAIRDRDELALVPGEPELALLGPNDALVFHHELETCGELAADAVIRVELEWTDPLAAEAKQMVWEQPVVEVGDGSLDARKGAATVAYARALRRYRDGAPPSEGYGAVLDAISLIAGALEDQPEDPDLIEMSQVLGKLEG